MKTYKEKQNNYKMNFVNSNILTLTPDLITIQLNFESILKLQEPGFIFSLPYIDQCQPISHNTTQHIARSLHTVINQSDIESWKYGLSDARVSLLMTKILCFAEHLILILIGLNMNTVWEFQGFNFKTTDVAKLIEQTLYQSNKFE